MATLSQGTIIKFREEDCLILSIDRLKLINPGTKSWFDNPINRSYLSCHITGPKETVKLAFPLRIDLTDNITVRQTELYFRVVIKFYLRRSYISCIGETISRSRNAKLLVDKRRIFVSNGLKESVGIKRSGQYGIHVIS